MAVDPTLRGALIRDMVRFARQHAGQLPNVVLYEAAAFDQMVREVIALGVSSAPTDIATVMRVRIAGVWGFRAVGVAEGWQLFSVWPTSGESVHDAVLGVADILRET